MTCPASCAVPFNHAMSRAQLFGLYKECLTHARLFPSIKRTQIIQDIRAEWREGAHLRDAAKINVAIETAVRGVATLKKYTTLDPNASAWTVELEKDPLGAATYEHRRALELVEKRRAAAASEAATREASPTPSKLL